MCSSNAQLLLYERIRHLKNNNIFSNIGARTDLDVEDSFNDISMHVCNDKPSMKSSRVKILESFK